MLNDIFKLLTASPAGIMEAAHKHLVDLGYDVAIETDALFLFAAPPAVLKRINDTIVPAICAHTDIVGVTPPKAEDLVLSSGGNRISLSPDSKSRVLGADDRAGVYAMFRILSNITSGCLPFIILTDKEEVGGVGAKAVVMSGLLSLYKENISCFIELDRKGNGEFVSYDRGESPNDKLEQALVEQGFKLDFGSYSDVADFTPHIGTTNVNLSVGYRHEHSKSEVLFLDELDLTVSRVLRLWKTFPTLFSEILEENSSRYGSVDNPLNDYVDWELESGEEVYYQMIDHIYRLSEEVEFSESANIEMIVNKFVADLPDRLIVNLADNLDEVVDLLCEANNDTDAQIATLLDHMLRDFGSDTQEEEEEDVCGALRRSGVVWV